MDKKTPRKLGHGRARLLRRGWLIGGVLALVAGLLLPAATVSAESGCHNRPPKTHDVGIEPRRD
ncbi:MAG: hypothetical protein AAF823_09090 [Planctomycetota bacterium]